MVQRSGLVLQVASMYDEIDGELRNVFMDKPYQGQDPEKAKVLFVGRDANYPENLCNHVFFERVKEYHQNGVTFWEKYKVHHPFLCNDFPDEFPKNKGGRPYHNNFTKLGLDSTYAKYISFIELRELPTRGVTANIPRSDFISKLKLSHMQLLDRWISQSGRKLIFLPKTIKEDMLKFRKGDTNLFQFLNFTPLVPRNASGLPVIYANNDVIVLETCSFAYWSIFGISSQMKIVIDLFLQGKQVSLMETEKTCTPKGEEKMATDEFPDFCKRIVGKTGWFPKGVTSVVLVNFQLDPPGVGRCRITRPAGVDPRLFLLHRDEVNLGIRACRDQGRLINTGELYRAGIRRWAVAPLYGLLKLYFDQAGFP